jgi:hypothetical protein
MDDLAQTFQFPGGQRIRVSQELVFAAIAVILFQKRQQLSHQTADLLKGPCEIARRSAVDRTVTADLLGVEVFQGDVEVDQISTRCPARQNSGGRRMDVKALHHGVNSPPGLSSLPPADAN